ncbi:MAG: methyltransferase domain-containing protein [Deltaproteobacteria bacterium]|nr:methyltransferase domain-containing protein [Deltaproteobacteria bacterium]
MAHWALIAGERGEGKTSLALRLLARLRRAGLRVEGFVQHPLDAPDGTRAGYDLVRLSRDEVVPLARSGVVPRGNRPTICHYVFEPDSFARGCDWVREDGAQAQVLLLDEVGRLEAEGRGHAAAVHLALGLPEPKVVILSVRAEMLFAVVHRFLGEDPVEPVAAVEAPAAPGAEDEFVEQVVRAVREGARADERRPVRAGGVDWREVCARMREESARQTERLADPGFALPPDAWEPRAARFARRVRAETRPDPVVEWLRPRLRSADSVLDVGAGTGRYARHLSALVDRVVAVEPSPAMRGELERLLVEERRDNVTVVPEAWPPTSAARADVVFCAHVVYSVPDLVPFLEALDEAAGRLCVVVCGLQPPNAVLAPVWEAVHGEPRRPLPGALEILNLLHQLGLHAGLEILSREDEHFRYESRDDALQALRKRLHLLPRPETDARIRQAIGALFTHHPDGSCSIRPVPRDAVLWWHATGRR